MTGDDDALVAACEEGDRLVDDFVDRLADTPRTAPADPLFVAAGDSDRPVGVQENGLGDAAEQHLPGGAALAPAHHDEVGVDGVGQVEDAVGGRDIGLADRRADARVLEIVTHLADGPDPRGGGHRLRQVRPLGLEDVGQRRLHLLVRPWEGLDKFRL